LCDNTAVRWSEYELAKTQMESEWRSKVAKDLAKHIEEYRKNDFPDLYIQGMERARLLALHNTSITSNTPKDAEQDKLF
jgi:hypothetical protein